MSIDEKLLLWKGKLSFKQYIPSKRLRYGIRYLRGNGTLATGTARSNHIKCHLPESFAKYKPPKGEYRFCGDGNLLVVGYHDKKEIYIMST